MSDTGSGGSSSLGNEQGGGDELDDPGRDPAILDPPRNIFGGADQDTGRGEPRGTGNVGPGDKPEAPTDDPETRADTPDHP